MDIQEVDVIGLKLFEATLDRDPHAFNGVAHEIRLNWLGVAMRSAEASCVLGCDAGDLKLVDKHI